MAVESVGGALESDVFDVLSSWLAFKNPIPEGWKGETSLIKAMAYSEAESLGMKGCSDLVSRARKTMLRLQSLSDAFNELASAIQAKLDAARMNFEAVSNMYSLVSLPTETLASIFECVVNGNVSDTNPTRWMAAVTLSHVCQYFRNAALSCPQLWSNISRSGEMAASCMLRSKEVPLDVELTVAFGPGADEQELHFEQLLRVVVPHSSRWRNLDIQFVSNSRDDDTVNRTPLDDSDFHQIFYEVDAPLLESLHIRNNKPENTLYRNSADFAYWNTPNLRSVTTVHYFPISLYGLENVTTLDITLILNQFNFADLLNDLSWMKNLEDLRLKLEHCSELFPVVAPGDLRPYGWTELPSVRRLRIETEFKDESSSASSLRKFYLFTALCFPGVVDLYVKVSGILDEKDDDLDHNTNLHLEGEIIRILWNPERFPCVESFRLEVCGICNDDSNTREWFESQEGSITLVIPINLLPSLKFFTLHSNRQLYIKDHYAVIPKIDPRDTLSWIVDVLEKQKERREWEEFHELVVVEVDNDEADDRGTSKATGTYMGDAALAWCKRRISESQAGQYPYNATDWID